MSFDLQDIITMTELRTHLAEVLNEIQMNHNKKLVTVNGKPVIQIQEAQQAEKLEKENYALKEENEILKTLLGLKKGLESYLKQEYLEHEQVEERFEMLLNNN